MLMNFVNSILHVYVWFQEHSWFSGVEWDKLYEIEAAYQPQVTDELDTQNFEKFEEVRGRFFWPKGIQFQ